MSANKSKKIKEQGRNFKIYDQRKIICFDVSFQVRDTLTTTKMLKLTMVGFRLLSDAQINCRVLGCYPVCGMDLGANTVSNLLCFPKDLFIWVCTYVPGTEKVVLLLKVK